MSESKPTPLRFDPPAYDYLDHTLTCARCGEDTGNNNQGHYWGLCKVLLAQGVPFREAVREMHFCCPGDCELNGGQS